MRSWGGGLTLGCCSVLQEAVRPRVAVAVPQQKGTGASPGHIAPSRLGRAFRGFSSFADVKGKLRVHSDRILIPLEGEKTPQTSSP